MDREMPASTTARRRSGGATGKLFPVAIVGHEDYSNCQMSSGPRWQSSLLKKAPQSSPFRNEPIVLLGLALLRLLTLDDAIRRERTIPSAKAEAFAKTKPLSESPSLPSGVGTALKSSRMTAPTRRMAL